ncbi:MAG: O-antigen ligase family protein, partial [Planctomycetota bacterium]
LLGCVWCWHKAGSGGRFILLTLEPLLIAGLLLVWFQTTPLKPQVLGQLSSEYQRLLEKWPQTQLPNSGSDSGDAAASESGPRWNTASLYPTETRHAFLMLLAYGIIGIVVAQRIRSEQDCYGILKLVGISGMMMAAFAIIQLVTSNDRFFWFYRQPYTGTREILKGAFTNRNHFAQFLSLSIGPLLWWALAGRAPRKAAILDRKGLGPAQGNHSRFDNLIDPVSLLLFCAVGGVLLSIMLSLSRGGMVAAGIASAVCLCGLWRSDRVRGSLAVAMLAIGFMAVGGLVIFGQEKVEDRVAQLASGDASKIDQMNARRTLWKADLDAIRAFPIVGTGIGSHRFIYPIYMEELAEFSGVSFSHAESSYIHLALEGGLAGLGLLVLGIAAVVVRMTWHIIRRVESHRVAAISAVLSGVLAGIVHAAADFIWYVPAVVVTTMILCVVGLRLCTGFRDSLGIFMPRIGWLAGAVACGLMLAKTQPELARRVTAERYWYQYLIATFDESASDDTRPVDTLEDLSTVESGEDVDEKVPSEKKTSETAQYDESSEEDKHARRTRALRDRINLLMASLKADPHQARTAISLADECLELFEMLQEKNENPFSLKDIRDTVRDSQFETQAEMLAFLKRAVGGPVKLLVLSDQMTRKALALCPVQDEGYEILVSTAFVRDPKDPAHEDMIDQAMLLGRNSASTRFKLGQSLFRDGRQQEGLEQWKIAFHLKREARLAICGILGRQFAVEAIFDEFRPTLDEIDEILVSYEVFRRPADIEKLLWA